VQKTSEVNRVLTDFLVIGEALKVRTLHCPFLRRHFNVLMFYVLVVTLKIAIEEWVQN